jgi:hypothetical protein
MFDSKTTLAGRLTDAVDLLIDFATLGEYGLEPAEAPLSCESRRRSNHSRSTAHPRSSNRARGAAVARG